MSNNNNFLIIQRTIDMIQWLENEKINLGIVPGVNKQQLVNIIFNLIFFIMKNFFTGFDLSFEQDSQNISEDSYEIEIMTPFYESEMNLLFSLLNSYLEATFSELLYEAGYTWRKLSFKIETTSLFFRLDLDTGDGTLIEEYSYYVSSRKNKFEHKPWFIKI